MKPSPEQFERIVAYLDGELSPEESARVEQKLAADEEFRQQLQGAERAWAALDELPMPSVGDDFSRTTMEMVVTAARQDVEAQTLAMPVQRRKNWLRTTLLVATTVLLGAVISRVVSQSPNRRLVADLPIIQNIDIYSQFRSLDFLEALRDQLGDDLPTTPGNQELLQAKLAEFQLVTADESRDEWLESLPENDQVTLRAKLNRFRDLSAQRKENLRELHQQISEANDRAELLRTMYSYQQWLNGLSPGEQYQLRENTESDKDRAREVARRMQQAASAQQFDLTPEQLRKLQDTVFPQIAEVIKSHRAELEDELGKRSKRELQRFRESSPQEQAMRAFHSAMRDSPEQRSKLSEIILSALPEEMKPAFKELPGWEKAILFRGWTRQARNGAVSDRRSGKRRGPQEISEQEMSDFFVDYLDPDDKERLLALPRDRMQEQLERLYNGHMRQAGRRPPARARGDRTRPPREGPPHDRPPPEGRRRDEGWGTGPPPRGGPSERPPFDGAGHRSPPRSRGRDRLERRPPPHESPRVEHPE